MPTEHRDSLPRQFRLKQYVISQLLGHGGFGMTYLAEDTHLMRKVAIKEMLPNDFATRERDGTTVVARSPEHEPSLNWARTRFIEEARTLAALHHSSILPVHEIFEANGTAYMVTAFIEGVTLEDWLRKYGRPGEPELISLSMDLLDALQLVHDHDFLHRDIKTENILIDKKTGKPVLIDFGNARVSTGEKTSSITAVLTAGYAPFEQYSTKARQGPWTDLYALGAVLHRSITGMVPEDSAARVTEDSLPVLSENPPEGYSLEFLETIDKAMRMKPSERWQSCREWKDALLSPSAIPAGNWMHGNDGTIATAPAATSPSARVGTVRRPTEAPPANDAQLPKKKSQKPMLAASILIGLLVAGGGAALMASGGKAKDSPRQTASEDTPSPSRESPDNDPRPTAANPAAASHELPFKNSIGMRFVPVEISGGTDTEGKRLLFSVTNTRNQDFMKWKSGHSATGGPGDPVTNVNFYEDALSFCKWLSEKEKRSYRLPSDLEWSCAAGLPEAGTTMPDPDASKRFGIQDLGSGIREWTSTLANQSGPRGVIVILRGHSGDVAAGLSVSDQLAMLSSRDNQNAFVPAPDIGFRCVLEP